MKTIAQAIVAEPLGRAERALGEAHSGTIVWFYLAVALISALCEIADAVYQVAADLPSREQ